MEEQGLNKPVLGSVFGMFFGLLIIVYLGLGGFRNNYEFGTCAILLFSFSLFVGKMGTTIPFRELLAFIAVFQWLIGPVFMYRLGNPHPIYKMFVEESVYMDYAFWGTALFIGGLLLPISVNRLRKVNTQFLSVTKTQFFNVKTGKTLILIGLIFLFLPGISFIAFVSYLMSQTLFIGVLVVLLSGEWKKNWFWLFLGGVGLTRMITSSLSFHTPVIWMTFFAIIMGWYFQWSFARRITLILVGGMAVFFIQFVKSDLRSAAGEGRPETMEELIWEQTLSNLGKSDALFSKAGFLKQLPRFNQGGVISRVMAHTPKKEAFAFGETLKATFEAVLLPRFLAPNKKKAGGKENYERFTGFEIRPGTSINISPLGEMWANFGQNGIYWMFFYGLLMNFIWSLYYRASQNKVFLLLWIPFFFLQSLKAETDILTPMNHMVKSAVIIFIFFKWILPNHKYVLNKD
ncbi:MAG: hypothetical protein ACI9YL_000070 [Luteibaculaceae bacterium]